MRSPHEPAPAPPVGLFVYGPRWIALSHVADLEIIGLTYGREYEGALHVVMSSGLQITIDKGSAPAFLQALSTYHEVAR